MVTTNFAGTVFHLLSVFVSKLAGRIENTSPLLVILLLWQFVTVITSDYSDVAFRRYVFSVTVIVTAMVWVILPEDKQHFQRMIKYLSLFILLSSYFGIIFMPEVSIHNSAEVLELVNAGSWRGQVWFSLLAAVLALRLHARAQIR